MPASVTGKHTAFVKSDKNLGNGDNNPQKGYTIRKGHTFSFLRLVILYLLPLSRYCRSTEALYVAYWLTYELPIPQIPPN